MMQFVFKRLRNGKRDRSYSGRYRLAPGERSHTVALETTDKQVALARLKKIVIEKQLEAEGIVAPKVRREAAIAPLASLLDEYAADLRAQSRSAQHIKDTTRRVRRVIRDAGWKRLADIRADSFIKWRTSVRVSAKTMKEYQASVSAWLTWLVNAGKLAANPLKRVPHVNTRGKQVRVTRALSLDELKRLYDAAPARRALIYLFLAYTGMRAKEVAQLVWRDLTLDGEHPCVLLRDETTKTKAKRALPLHPLLAREMRVFHAPAGEVSADARVFDPFPRHKTLMADLAAAGIAPKDATGRLIHFHAFRKTFQTLGVQSGVNQRAAQELLGHSDPRLTANIYTDVAAIELHTEVAKLPWLLGARTGESRSAHEGAPSRFLTICREIASLSQDYDLERVAVEMERAKLVGATGLEPHHDGLEAIDVEQVCAGCRALGVVLRTLAAPSGAIAKGIRSA